MSGASLQLPSLAPLWPETASFFGIAPFTKRPAHTETYRLSQCLGSLPALFSFTSVARTVHGSLPQALAPVRAEWLLHGGRSTRGL